MKIWTSEHTFNHPWETVATAAWRKYPNPHNTAVIGTDVVERKVENGVLHTQRLVSSIWYFPKWATALIGSAKVCYAAEQSEVNLRERQMTLKTINLTFYRHIAVNETLKYVPHPSDPSKTLLKQEAVVTVQGVPLTNYMENLLTNTISNNAGKGRQAMEWVINKINDEVKDLTRTTDEFVTNTKRSIDGLTSSAKKSMDDISQKAKKSLDDIQHLKINGNFGEC
ncbi:protein slowmo [Anthonomus grandis grandis]|uniref:protein slowmo n=1 Tax=Anthonomus grandis grandis TaxID=2921223 RepID=UPI0021654F6F|nr:protein slowmo [Anthonomus grandis grandis]